MAKLVSATYGDALFSLACEENKVDSFYEDVILDDFSVPGYYNYLVKVSIRVR